MAHYNYPPQSTDPMSRQPNIPGQPTPRPRGFYLTKEWWRSMTVWGVIISALMHLLIAVGIDELLVSKTGEVIMQMLPSIIGLVADMVAAWGRSRADTKLVASSEQATV